MKTNTKRLIPIFLGILLLQKTHCQNSAYYASVPFCKDIPAQNIYCNLALNSAGSVGLPQIVVIPNNPNGGTKLCTNTLFSFNFIGSLCGSDNAIDMGDNSGLVTNPYHTTISPYIENFIVDYTYCTPGKYTVTMLGAPTSTATNYQTCAMARFVVDVEDCSNLSCQAPFAPPPGDYVLSFWVKEDQASFIGSAYSSGIDIDITNSSGSTTIPIYANGTFNSQNNIIDGWQKVEKTITIPSGASAISINLKNNNASADAYFDDIRFHPFNASFKSFVYDPVTLRLSAELDERNYATFYEYDEEGQLIRVKKETERGIKTIKESRTSVSK